MQIARPAHTTADAIGAIVASQTIDMHAVARPGGGVSMWSTDRVYRLAGARGGVGTFATLTDAVEAARALSAGPNPGLAVLTWRGGFRLHDVHAASRTYFSSAAYGPVPPVTHEIRHSSVPFSAGNLRFDTPSSGLAVALDERLVALVDGSRGFRVDAGATWAGHPLLVRGGV